MHFEVKILTLLLLSTVAVIAQDEKKDGEAPAFQFNDFLGKLTEYVAPITAVVGTLQGQQQEQPNKAPVPVYQPPSAIAGLGAAGNPNLLNQLGLARNNNSPYGQRQPINNNNNRQYGQQQQPNANNNNPYRQQQQQQQQPNINNNNPYRQQQQQQQPNINSNNPYGQRQPNNNYNPYGQPQNNNGFQQQLQNVQQRAQQHQYAANGYQNVPQQQPAWNPVLNLNNLPPPTPAPTLFSGPRTPQSQQTYDLIQQLTADNTKPKLENSLLQNIAAANVYQNQAIFTAKPKTTTAAPQIGDLTSANGFGLADFVNGGKGGGSSLLQTLIGTVGNQLGKPALGGIQGQARRAPIRPTRPARYPARPRSYRKPGTVVRGNQLFSPAARQQVNQRRSLTPKYAKRNIANLSRAPVRRPTNIANSAPRGRNPFSEHRKAPNFVPGFGGNDYNSNNDGPKLEDRIQRTKQEDKQGDIQDEEPGLEDLVRRKENVEEIESVKIVDDNPSDVKPVSIEKTKVKQVEPVKQAKQAVKPVLNDVQEVLPEIIGKKSEKKKTKKPKVSSTKVAYRKTKIESSEISETFAPTKREPPSAQARARKRLERFRRKPKLVKLIRPDENEKDVSKEPKVLSYARSEEDRTRLEVQNNQKKILQSKIISTTTPTTTTSTTTTTTPTTTTTTTPSPIPIRAALRSIAYRKSPIARRRFSLARDLERIEQERRRDRVTYRDELENVPREELVPNAIPKIPKGSRQISRETLKLQIKPKPKPDVKVVPNPERELLNKAEVIEDAAVEESESREYDEDEPLYSWLEDDSVESVESKRTEFTVESESDPAQTVSYAADRQKRAEIKKNKNESKRAEKKEKPASISKEKPKQSVKSEETEEDVDKQPKNQEILPEDGFENLPADGFEREAFDNQVKSNELKSGLNQHFESPREEIIDPDLGPVVVPGPRKKPQVIRSTLGASPLDTLTQNVVPSHFGRNSGVPSSQGQRSNSLQQQVPPPPPQRPNPPVQNSYPTQPNPNYQNVANQNQQYSNVAALPLNHWNNNQEALNLLAQQAGIAPFNLNRQQNVPPPPQGYQPNPQQRSYPQQNGPINPQYQQPQLNLNQNYQYQQRHQQRQQQQIYQPQQPIQQQTQQLSPRQIQPQQQPQQLPQQQQTLPGQGQRIAGLPQANRQPMFPNAGYNPQQNYYNRQPYQSPVYTPAGYTGVYTYVTDGETISLHKTLPIILNWAAFKRNKRRWALPNGYGPKQVDTSKLPTDRGKFIRNSGLTVDQYVNKLQPNTYSNNAVQNLEKYFGALTSKDEPSASIHSET